MLSQGVIEKAEHVSKQRGIGRGQPWLHFDQGDEVLFEILQETSSIGPAIPSVSWSQG